MRMIDADAMLEYLNLMYDKQDDSDEPYNCAVLGVINYIKHKAPTIDAVSVVHGEWIEAEEDWRQQIAFWRCSECGHATSTMYNFCPNCGAKMDKENDELDMLLL